MKKITVKNLKWKRWRITFLATAVVVFLCSCAWFESAKSDDIKSVEELEAYLKKMTDNGSPQGMSFMVIKNNQIIYKKGFGWAYRHNKIAASPETVYHWFSITKIVTAIAILQLQEKGKIQLDDSVIQYLPFFKVQYPSNSGKAITIRHLLNHSSGLPDPGIHLMSWIHFEGEPSVNQTELVKKVLPKYSKLMFEPGSDEKYTNVGYMVLGAIIEKVTGQTYEDYVRQNILTPLGMNHTDFVYTKAMEPNEACGSHPLFNMYTPAIPFLCRKAVLKTYKRHIWFKRFYTDQTPSTGLIGPVTDLSRLIMAYLNHGELDGQKILSRESIDAMTYNSYMKAKKDDSLSIFRQGIGWSIFHRNHERLLLAHDGGGLGFFTLIQVIPEENLGFILFTNDVTSKDEGWKIVNKAAKLKW